jgi:hypothetical protein
MDNDGRIENTLISLDINLKTETLMSTELSCVLNFLKYIAPEFVLLLIHYLASVT